MKKVLYLLGQLTDTDVEWMIAKGVKEQISPGATIIHAGQPVAALYIVLKGDFTVDVPGLSDHAPPRLGCGEVVGEMSFIDSCPASATVTSVADSVVLSVSRPDLAAKLTYDDGFAARFYRSIALFLSHRFRAREQRMTLTTNQTINEDVIYQDEIDPSVLDNVHMAGTRFERVLQRLLAS